MPTAIKLVIVSDQWGGTPPDTSHEFHKVFDTMEDALNGLITFAHEALKSGEED